MLQIKAGFPTELSSQRRRTACGTSMLHILTLPDKGGRMSCCHWLPCICAKCPANSIGPRLLCALVQCRLVSAVRSSSFHNSVILRIPSETKTIRVQHNHYWVVLQANSGRTLLNSHCHNLQRFVPTCATQESSAFCNAVISICLLP